MAKKKKPGKKKKGSSKAGPQKLETKLWGYWKKQAWGELITLYQRHWDKAIQSPAAKLWNPAVYNLLLRTVFAEQDFSLLESIYAEISRAPEVSEPNRKILQVTAVLLEVYQARGHPGLVSELPADPPAPFDKLAAKLQETLTPGNSPLQDYLQGRLKRARKGEKHFTLAVKASQQFDALRAQHFQPPKGTALSQFKKSITDLNAALKSNQGVSSPVLQDMQALAQAMHELYSRPKRSAYRTEIASGLQSKGFHGRSHPAIQSMTRAFLLLGRSLCGTQWEQGQRLALKDTMPEEAPSFPEHVQAQIQALQQLQKKNTEDIPLPKQALSLDVWSRRERLLLLLAFMHLLEASQHELLQELFLQVGFKISDTHLAEILENYLTTLCETLIEIYHLYSSLGLQDSSFLTLASHQWQETVAPFPFVSAVPALDQLIKVLHNSPAPDSVLLVPLLKRAEVAARSSTGLNISKTIQARIPLQVSSSDLQQAVSYLTKASNLRPVLQTWKACLSQDKYQELIRILLHKVLQSSFEASDDPFDSFDHSDALLWTDIPSQVMQDLLQDVDQDFALLGLMRLSAYTQSKTFPMPANAKQAALFLDALPAPEILDSILKWMLTWPSTPYRNTFLATLIRKHADYLTRNQGWSELAEIIADNRLRKVAELVWNIWSEAGLWQELQNNQDLYAAQEELRPLLPRTKNSPKPKPKPQSKKEKQELPLFKLLEAMEKETNNTNKKK
ncbi:MAG: hypothetical protein ACLFMR_08775 [Desulfohalobiaceae bacterium]